MRTLKALSSITARLWNTGNRWARFAITCIMVWPVTLIALSTGRWEYATAILGVVFAMGLLVIAFKSPSPTTCGRRRRKSKRALFAQWSSSQRTVVVWTATMATFLAVVIAAIFVKEWMFATAILGIVPAVAIIILLLTRIDPLVAGALALFETGRTVLQWICTLVGAELALGFYFAVVPVANDPKLVFLVVLAAATIFFLSFGVQGKLASAVKFLLALFLIGATVVFYMGGREKIQKKINGENAILNTDSMFMQHIEKKPGELVINENGLWVERQSSKPAQLVKQRFGTRIDVIAKEDGGEEIGLRTDCAEIVEVTTLQQGERIEIIPFPQTSAIYNRCSFSISETMPPEFYEVEGQQTINDPSHAELLPCKKAPAQINTFLIKDARGELIDCHWFTNKKRVIKILNDIGEDLKIYHAYNSSQTGQPGGQIGLVRGATITFRITKRKV